MSTVKFGKCFAEFMIPIALHKELGGLGFAMTIEVTNMRMCCGKANKLKYINTLRGTTRDIVIKEREIKNIKIKIILFFIYLNKNCTIVNR